MRSLSRILTAALALLAFTAPAQKPGQTYVLINFTNHTPYGIWVTTYTAADRDHKVDFNCLMPGDTKKIKAYMPYFELDEVKQTGQNCSGPNLRTYSGTHNEGHIVFTWSPSINQLGSRRY